MLGGGWRFGKKRREYATDDCVYDIGTPKKPVQVIINQGEYPHTYTHTCTRIHASPSCSPTSPKLLATITRGGTSCIRNRVVIINARPIKTPAKRPQFVLTRGNILRTILRALVPVYLSYCIIYYVIYRVCACMGERVCVSDEHGSVLSRLT